MINQISALEARNFINSKEALFVDIRDGVSFDRSHIPGALNLNSDNIENFVNDTDKSKKIVCYCYHGISSLQVAEYFLESGFQKVYSLTGGFESWTDYEADEDGKINSL